MRYHGSENAAMTASESDSGLTVENLMVTRDGDALSLKFNFRGSAGEMVKATFVGGASIPTRQEDIAAFIRGI